MNAIPVSHLEVPSPLLSPFFVLIRLVTMSGPASNIPQQFTRKETDFTAVVLNLMVVTLWGSNDFSTGVA